MPLLRKQKLSATNFVRLHDLCFKSAGLEPEKVIVQEKASTKREEELDCCDYRPISLSTREMGSPDTVHK